MLKEGREREIMSPYSSKKKIIYIDSPQLFEK